MSRFCLNLWKCADYRWKSKSAGCWHILASSLKLLLSSKVRVPRKTQEINVGFWSLVERTDPVQKCQLYPKKQSGSGWLWMALVGCASDTLAVTDDGHLWPTTSSKVLLEFDHIVTAALVFIGCMHICLFCKGFTCKGEICERTAGSVKWLICERTAAATFKHHLFLSDSRIIFADNRDRQGEMVRNDKYIQIWKEENVLWRRQITAVSQVLDTSQWKQRMRIQKFVLCQPHVCVVQKHVQTCSVWKLPQDFRTSSGFKRCNPVIIPSVYGLIRLPKKALARQCCESNACKPSIGWPLGTVLLAEFTLENSVALGVTDVTGEQENNLGLFAHV